MTVGEKIRVLREAFPRKDAEPGLSQEEFGEKIGVTRNIVGSWERGSSRVPFARLKKIAVLFDKPVEYFQADSSVGFGHVARHGGEGLDAPSGVDMSTAAEAVYVPVLGTVPADRFAFSLDAIPEEKIPNPYGSKKVFALRVIGDCMEPTFRDGEYIYFSMTQPVADGKIVLARLDAEHTVKRYFKSAAGIELRPDNPRYKGKTHTTNKLEIIAVAVGRYGKL